MILILLVSSIFCFATTVGSVIAAPVDSVGTTAIAYSKIVPNARAVALGEAFSSLANNSDAVYWNPAALVQTRLGVSLMYNSWIQDINNSSISYAQSFPVIGSFGISANLVQVPGIEYRGDTPSDEPLEKFDANYLTTSIAYAYPITKLISLGLSTKYFNEQVGIGKTYADYRASGSAFDIGLLIQNLTKNVNLSLVAQNFGSPIKNYQLPQNIKLGLGLFVDDQKSFLLLTDINYPMDNRLNIHIGTEFVIAKLFALRAGYKTDTVNFSGIVGLTAGFGLILGPVMFDFAWVPYNNLGNSYRATLSFQL